MKGSYEKNVASPLMSLDVLWTYFGVSLEYVWSAFGCLWMTLDNFGVPVNPVFRLFRHLGFLVHYRFSSGLIRPNPRFPSAYI